MILGKVAPLYFKRHHCEQTERILAVLQMKWGLTLQLGKIDLKAHS